MKKLPLFKQCKKSKNYLWEIHRLNKRNKKKIAALRELYMRRKKRLSNFHQYLIAKRVLSNLYGGLKLRVLKKQKCLAKERKGPIVTNFVRMLESRLDTVVFRMNFFTSFAAARQSISHGFVVVNYKPINICSYALKYGDIVSFLPKVRTKISPILKNQIRIAKLAVHKVKENNPILERRQKHFVKRKVERTAQENDKNLNSQKSEKENSKSYKSYLLKKKGKVRNLRLGLSFLGNNPLNANMYSGLRLKPAYLEINYVIATAIVLFPTQDLYLPVIVDLRESIKGIK